LKQFAVERVSQMHIADDSVTVHFLVYTKSTSFDYQWIYGLADKSVEKALQTYVTSWLTTTHLAKLPPVTTFFRLHDHFALMIAQESKTRVDAEKRPIFQRAFFLWKPASGLCYHHLEPLSHILKEQAEEVYPLIPNDTVRLEPQTQQFTFGIPHLDKESSDLIDKTWDLPGGLTWPDIIRERLTVEAPVEWDFGKMLAGLIDQPISPRNMLYIGSALYLENRNPPNESWLVGAKDSNPTAEPRILNASSEPVSAAALERYKQRVQTQDQKLTSSSPHVQAESGLNKVSQNPGSGSQGSAVRDGKPPETLKPDLKAKILNEESIEQFFSQFAQPDLYFNKTNRSELIRFLQKVLERDRLPLEAAEVRLLLLLTPATLSSYHNGHYGSVIVSWNNLLSEILIFYHQPSKGMAEEWRRRLSQLSQITIQNLASPPEAWRGQFDDACLTLQRLLENL
jgi:hypothetical protein